MVSGSHNVDDDIVYVLILTLQHPTYIPVY